MDMISNAARRFLRRPRRAAGMMALGGLGVFAGPLVQQCAPPPPDWSGIGQIQPYQSGNAISGGVRAHAAQANGYTQLRSECTYFMNMPAGHQSFHITTSGAWVNPPDGDPQWGTTQVDSRCEVPSVRYLPAGAYPTLLSVSFTLG